MPSDRPIFVVGCPRSGTTMLQLMLHSHQRIAVAPETRIVIPAYNRRRSFGDLRVPENRRKVARWIVTGKNTKFKELRLDRDQLTEAVADAPPTLGSIIETVFDRYAQRYGKPRWGDKRPSYFHRVDMLRRMFPDAQFIHLIRDGRDAVASLKQMPWFGGDVYGAMAIWAESIDYGRRNARRLPDGTFYELRYEDLTARPEEELTKLCAFLGEDYDPAMVEHEHLARESVPSRKVWHQNTHQGVTQARIGSWENKLEPWEIALAEQVLGGRLRRQGYELLGDAGRPALKHLARYEKIAVKRRVRKWKREVSDRYDRMRQPNQLATLLPAGRDLSAGSPAGRDSAVEAPAEE